MDTYMIEYSILEDEYKLSILTLEQEIFMNSIGNNILNESIIHEGFKEKFKEVIGKIKEGFKKLIEKVKEIFEKLKKAIQSKFFSIAFNDLKKLPDDADLGEKIDLN